MTAPRHIRLHTDDNIIIAIDALQPGIEVDGIAVTTRTA